MIGGLSVVGFCLFFCSSTVFAVFDGTFLSMGGMMFLPITSFVAFFAFGLVRSLTYANNALESWSALSSVLSAFALCASGAAVSYLEGRFFPQEVEFRSLNLDGYEYLCWTAGMPLFMVLLFPFAEIHKKQTSDQTQRRPLFQFIKENWKYDLLVTALFFFVLTASAWAMLVFSPPLPLSEKHLSYEAFYRRDDFPADGSDFCYNRSNSSFLCDFAISEDGFLDWAKTKTDWKIDAILPDAPVNIYQSLQREEVVIANGLTAERKRDENSHGGIIEQAVFDRDSGRVYYSFYIL